MEKSVVEVYRASLNLMNSMFLWYLVSALGLLVQIEYKEHKFPAQGWEWYLCQSTWTWIMWGLSPEYFLPTKILFSWWSSQVWWLSQYVFLPSSGWVRPQLFLGEVSVSVGQMHMLRLHEAELRAEEERLQREEAAREATPRVKLPKDRGSTSINWGFHQPTVGCVLLKIVFLETWRCRSGP